MGLTSERRPGNTRVTSAETTGFSNRIPALVATLSKPRVVQELLHFIALVAAALSVGIGTISLVPFRKALLRPVHRCVTKDRSQLAVGDDPLAVIADEHVTGARGGEQSAQRVRRVSFGAPGTALVLVRDEAGLPPQRDIVAEPAARDQFRDVIVPGVLARIVRRIDVQQVDLAEVTGDMHRVRLVCR